MAIKVAHIADIHLGLEVGPIDPETRMNGKVLDTLDTLDAVIDFCEDNDADLIVIAGDIYHKPNPDPTYQREFSTRLMRMSTIAPTVITIGNHEMPGSMDRASPVDIFDALQIPNVTVGWDYQIHRIETKAGPIQVGTFPYPLRSQFLTHGELSRPTEKRMRIYANKIGSKLRKLASEVNPDELAILVAHIDVAGIDYGNGYSMVVGLEAQARLEDLTLPAWDYVALGHIHKAQILHKDMPVVAYSGNLERVTFSEENDDKGFIWVELNGLTVKTEFIRVDARPYVTVNIDVPDDIRRVTRFLEEQIEVYDVKSAVVRCKIVIDEPSRVDSAKIFELFDAAQVYYLQELRIEPRRTERTSRVSGKLMEAFQTGSRQDIVDAYLYTLDLGSELKPTRQIAHDLMEEVENEKAYRPRRSE